MNPSILHLMQSINSLNGISYKTAEKLEKKGISRIIDLLFYFPIKTITRKRCDSIKDLTLGENCIILLKAIEYVKLKNSVQVICVDLNGEVITVTFFGSFIKYLNTYLPLNQEVVILGVPEIYKNNLVINHPERVLKNKKIEDVSLMDVLYKQHQDITSYQFKTLISKALSVLNSVDIPEWLDKEFIKKDNLPSFKEAIIKMHNPKSMHDLSLSSNNILRIAIDEMLAYHLALLQIRESVATKDFINFNPDNSLNKVFLKSLPFKLTEDQISVLKNLKQTFSNNKQNTILIQGDVGSGKTVVCFIATLFFLESGYQVAFMAPTEILATQHYNFFLPFAKELNLQIALLKGKEIKSKKDKILNDLKNKQIHILIGTHAIFQQKVEFNNLGLVIIDEQHRFGVNQRLQLVAKGNNPNIILTTATPIPRTLALAIYGDIEAFDIKHKPSNRKPVLTSNISKNRIMEVVDRVKSAVNNSQKVFWICPLVLKSEKIDKTSVIERATFLEDFLLKPQIYVVHGEMKSNEKDAVINAFKNTNEGAVLVSTTVIEVGIDIPSCNIIIIEDADTFGLAQLHQLRGRVGRGEEQGSCVLIYSNKMSVTGRKKLTELKNSNDGFYLAEKDLEIRGYGDLMGVEQSGSDFFKIANLDVHAKYLLPSLKHAKLLFHMAQANKEVSPNKTLTMQKNIEILLNIFNKDFTINYTKI